jgi:glycosyltransferase involved in cell wall biosynthesis
MKTLLYLNATGEISGAERSLLTMLDALDRERWQPVVAAPDGPLLEEAARRTVGRFTLPLAPLRRPRTLREFHETFMAIQAGWREVGDALARIRPHLLHCNSTTAMLYALRVTTVPTVWQQRDLVPLAPWGSLLYRRASRVAAISSAVRDDLLRYAGDGGGKISLLMPAVDTEHFAPAPDRAAMRARLGLPADGLLIGNIAQFVPWKRHHLFLDVLEGLAGIPWHAVLAGAAFAAPAGYLASLRERLAQPPLAGRVSWLPWQPDPAPLLSALDICMLTSEYEPFGRVLIEAMACGVPVLAIDQAGPQDIVVPDDTGLLAPADPPALSAALARLLTDTDLRTRFATAARARAETTFSLPAHREKLNVLYGQLLPE